MENIRVGALPILRDSGYHQGLKLVTIYPITFYEFILIQDLISSWSFIDKDVRVFSPSSGKTKNLLDQLKDKDSNFFFHLHPVSSKGSIDLSELLPVKRFRFFWNPMLDENRLIKYMGFRYYNFISIYYREKESLRLIKFFEELSSSLCMCFVSRHDLKTLIDINTII